MRKSQSPSPNKVASTLAKWQRNLSSEFEKFYDLSNEELLKRMEKFSLSPAIDILEDKDWYKIEVEMPGLDIEDVKLSVENQQLMIWGEKSWSKKDEHKSYINREINYGCYERRMNLPQDADVDKISATFKKGMLWVVVPKKSMKSSNSRSIKVQRIQ